MAPKLRPEGADFSAFPGYHPKPGDPSTIQYYLGLTKLEIFTLVAMHAYIVSNYPSAPDRAVEMGFAQLKALETVCPSCSFKRHQYDAGGEVYYVCTRKECEQFGVNEVLRKESPEKYRAMIEALEPYRR